MSEEKESLWRHPLLHTLLGAVLGVAATFGGTYYGFRLTVRHELQNYRDDLIQARLEENKFDDANASALATQLELNEAVARSNLRMLDDEIRIYPAIRDLVPLAPMLEFQGVGPGVRFPGMIGLDPALRTQALKIMLDVRAINGSIALRDEVKKSRQFSALAFDGSRPGDPQPGDAERDSLNKYLRDHHRRVLGLSSSFLARFDSLTHRTRPGEK
ncbi:MAG: hypothetical protein HOP12_02300 [Candidatus Eisenbacteria bacterium]|uniref:Uncharacterized protein n=1 Tax=Eiseniibacteriota bacterium TaxID=2212470 RepID=A0A849SES1_UNCEI|nr:hypothetical protein [Candidatus Eisenbacteria bacterium]